MVGVLCVSCVSLLYPLYRVCSTASCWIVCCRVIVLVMVVCGAHVRVLHVFPLCGFCSLLVLNCVVVVVLALLLVLVFVFDFAVVLAVFGL